MNSPAPPNAGQSPMLQHDEYVTREYLQVRWKVSESTIKRMEIDEKAELDLNKVLTPHRFLKRAVRYLLSEVLKIEKSGFSPDPDMQSVKEDSSSVGTTNNTRLEREGRRI